MSVQEQAISQASIVEDALKTMGEPVRLRDIIELTKDKVDWKEDAKLYAYQMKVFMNHTPSIQKAGFGKYEYVDIKKKKKEKNKRKDDSVLEVSDKDKDLLASFRNETSTFVKSKPKKKYKVGDIVEGYVSGIEDYGAFIENENGEMQGLVHITNIRNGITDDVSRYFKIGDKVTAKVIAVKLDGKIGLSTKEFELPDYFRNEELANKFKEVASKVEPLEKPVTTFEVSKEERESEEHKEIYRFIQGITGVVSDATKEKIKELIQKQGMFKFTMALAETHKDFEVDVSMLFAKEIETKMRDGL